MNPLFEELLGFAAALLLFEALHRADLVARSSIRLADILWLLVLTVTTAACARPFPAPGVLLVPAVALGAVNILRGGAGLLARDAGILERWRYVPVAALYAFLGVSGWTVAAFLLLAARRKNVRLVLLVATQGAGPFRISSVDVDQILPEAVRYDRPEREKGITLVEVIVSMTLLATVSATVFTAAVQRSVRIRQTRESAVVREAAVSALEKVGAVEFRDLAEWDGTDFAVPGDGQPGRVRVFLPEPGLARITVTAPRRGAVPVELTTWRRSEAGR